MLNLVLIVVVCIGLNELFLIRFFFRITMEVEPNDLCNRFKQAVADDQQWLAQIFMPGADGVLVNIVPFFDPTTIQEAEFKIAGYPKSSSFLFHGFHGIEDTDRLINALKSSAAMSGSRLRASKRKLKKGGTKLVSIDMFCNKSKHNSKRHSFKENNIQANCTIIQREHQIASRKGVSRSLTNSLVIDNSAPPTKKVSPIKRSTSIRPLEKKNCCAFGFTIFCASDNNLWYLSYSPG